MRQAGTFSNREQGQRIVDFLHTQQVRAKLDKDGENWAVWIRDEDQLAKAQAEIEQFRADPNSPRYSKASQAAEALRKKEAKADEERRRNLVELRNRWDTSPGGRRPLTMLLIGACILVGILTELGENQTGEVFQALLISPTTPRGITNPIAAIQSGQVWRLITPIFIHFGPWHLVMNMFVLYSFGSLIENRRGSLRFGLLVLATAIASNLGQYYFPTRFEDATGLSVIGFGGMSGVWFGLLGYLWMKSEFDPQAQLFVSPNVVMMGLLWLLLGWSGALVSLFGVSVANWAHSVGLVAGMAIGYAPVAWRRLRRQ